MTPRRILAVASNYGAGWGGHNCLLPNGYVRTYYRAGLLVQFWHLLLEDSVIAVQRVYLRCDAAASAKAAGAGLLVASTLMGDTTVGRGVTPVRKRLPVSSSCSWMIVHRSIIPVMWSTLQ